MTCKFQRIRADVSEEARDAIDKILEDQGRSALIRALRAADAGDVSDAQIYRHQTGLCSCNRDK